MTNLKLVCLAFALSFGVRAAAGEPPAHYDLARDRVLYEIGYTHLDTQYRWAYPQVIRDFIPNTVRSNLMLFEKYPDFIYNWTGANRYRLMKEYHPEEFAAVREWVAKGRWFPAGSSWEENDVNLPSPESEIRQIMFGHDFFKKEFGVESSEYMDPDAFGFPASLPSVLAHCGLRGFSTAKLTWNSAVGIPFNVGVWTGPDGNSVVAALNMGSYETKITNNLATDAKWLRRLDDDGAKSGIRADYVYYGNKGDRGGAPDEASVAWLEKSLNSPGPVRVVSASADQLFDEITEPQKRHLPQYRGDLLLVDHSTGSLTSQAYMKKWNRENELLANAAESAAVAAQLLGATPYPREKLHHAWELVLACQFHDMLPGTALPKAYEFCWNDEVIALNSFAEVLQSSVGAVARGLDTRTEGTPLVVYNPLSIAREDVVEAELDDVTGGTVQVLDGDGRPVPTQMLAGERDEAAGKCRFLFLAKVPPVSFTVFTVTKSVAAAPASPLKVSDRILENARYKVTLNDAGDLASVFDKSAGRELLSAPVRLEFLTQNPTNYPAWNMDWHDQTNAPRTYVASPVKFQIVENGPVRVAITVEREAENSVFQQTVRLAAGDAGNHVEVASQIDWQSRRSSLKLALPLTVSNPVATYNWDLGKIQRGNNTPNKYEVPTHGWFDLTDTTGRYGVTILTGAKYGSDKPADDLVRLTLLYTPGMENAHGRCREQQWQDWGRHDFVFGIYGHKDDWRDGKSDWQAARLDQPLLAFRTAAHDGKLGHGFSLLQADSDQVAIRTIKLAEDSDQVIVRLQELNGAKAKPVDIKAGAGIENAVEVNGLEKPLGSLKLKSNALKLEFKPYQLRSLALKFALPDKLSSPVSMPVELPYNLNAFGFRGVTNNSGFDGAGAAIPAEMMADTVTAEGVNFQIGPRGTGKQNAVACTGQTIPLPEGQFGRLYLLAAAVDGDADGTFTIDGRPTPLHMQNWTGCIGQWDNRVFKGVVPELTYSVTNPLERIDQGFIKRDPLAWFCSHRYMADGSDAIYSYSYLFKYRLDLPPAAKNLTLPDNPRIRILAATVAKDDNDATQPAQPLYDDFSGRKPVVLRDGWDTTAKH